MGNAATCSLVDVVGTVTVTQTDGQILEFVQPIFAAQVKKLHPGNWLVHYVSALHSDPTLGMGFGHQQQHHSKMSMLQGNEELQAGEIYFLLPIPSHFRKQLFGSSKQRTSSSNSSSSSKASAQIPAATSGPPTNSTKPHQQHAASCVQHQQFTVPDGSMARRQSEPSPVFSVAGSSSNAAAEPPPKQQHQHQHQHQHQQQQPRLHKRCSSRHRIHVFDWRPSLMTIQEAF